MTTDLDQNLDARIARVFDDPTCALAQEVRDIVRSPFVERALAHRLPPKNLTAYRVDDFDDDAPRYIVKDGTTR